MYASLFLLRRIALCGILGLCTLTSTARSSDPISFELDVQPILTKAGCNSGACHGKQGGQNGFQLSLLAYDSDQDFNAITRDGRGRRIFPASPQDSLLLTKAVASVPHGGGQRFGAQSSEFHILLSWLQQGAVRLIPDEPILERIELTHDDYNLRPGETVQLTVTAHYSNGASRDVTPLADYLSNDSAVASAGESGQILAGSLPGETAVMIRYMNHIRVANVVIPGDEQFTAAEFATLPRGNFIDDLVYAKLQRAGVWPSKEAEDAVFLRRVYLDLIGQLPTPEEAQRFLATDSPSKREYLIDELLDRPEYVDHWANQWADLLRPNPYRVGIKAVFNYDNWIRQQFRENVPYDQFVHSLVTAKGSTWRNGAATLYRDRRSPDEMATLVSQLFLGVRLECAKCHHHPFEKWSQTDFYQFAAFFGRVGHKGTGLSPPISGGEETVFVASKGEVRHPKTGKTMNPTPLFGGNEQITASEDPREELAQWMTSTDNEYFAKVQVNRIWAALMNRGLVEPVDDLRLTNPPTNPELLSALAKHFQDNGYDLKDLLKIITMSRTYSLSSTPSTSNVADRVNYSRHYRHRLRAEALLDAIAMITETKNSIGGMPADARSNQVWTHRASSVFLDTFGRPDANQDPPCERTSDSTVTQSLHMLNSVELERRIRSDTGRAARLAESELTSDEIATELYLAIYSRMPTDEERQNTSRFLAVEANARRAAIEDLIWAMLNTPEFLIQN